MITVDDHKNLLFVQYDAEGRPFGVITAGATNDHQLYWNFEWSKAFGYSLYHMSGCGGERHAHMSNFVVKEPKHRFWARNDIALVWTIGCGRGFRTVPCLQRHWEAMGNIRIGFPLAEDPFADAVHGEAVYCRTCDDWLPDEEWNYCEHLAVLRA